MHGHELIERERKRQIDQEGFDSQHDDAYHDSELEMAASCYLDHAIDPVATAGCAPSWPWDAAWFRPRNELDALVKAGALIAAAIDRRLRLGESPA